MLLFARACLAQWLPLGPEGGDVRSLTYDPRHVERIFLGTSAGQLYVSNDNGRRWARLAHLGEGNDYVLDRMELDPQSGTIYVAAWDAKIERKSGDLFRSQDEGKTWQTLPGMHGKSIRALRLAPADPRIIVVGALDGVYRSRDSGDTWERISPRDHAEIKNIESVAIDPRNPEIIYAGTWHLAWKTSDGGKTWQPIRNGVDDDSDVFSIIVDAEDPRNVYLSACSGIYKSTNSAASFHKVQGIPYSARRTHVLKQDPANPAVVYAGTTEGLWRTTDAGRTWHRITESMVVNDVHIDPQNPSRILIATDRAGVLASNDAGKSVFASNHGFSHRVVLSVVVDHHDLQTIYAGLLNDKEFGGVFVSRDGGLSWRQMNKGIHKLDVFTLTQTENGDILAGTNAGVFRLRRGGKEWQAINGVPRESAAAAEGKGPRPSRARAVHSESGLGLQTRVLQLDTASNKWFAAADSGLYESADEGKSWSGGPILGYRDFRAVRTSGPVVLAVTPKAVLLSGDGGGTWKMARLPSHISIVYDAAIGPDKVLWLATREGAFRSADSGATWKLLLAGSPVRHIASIRYDLEGDRLLAVSGAGQLFSSSGQGLLWQRLDPGFAVRAVTVSRGRLFAASAFDGVIMQPNPAGAELTAIGH